MTEEKRYDVVRHFMRSGVRRTIFRDVTLMVAQLHCSSKEASSRTCKLRKSRRRTSRSGPWFDGYR